MKIKEAYMTQSIQPYACTVCETGKDLAKNKPEIEDNRHLLLAVFDSLNKLCEKLSRINYLMERKK